MRIVVAGLTIAFLSACGTNQTEQLSKSQPLVKQDEVQVVMEKPESTELSESITSENNQANNDGIQDLKVEETNSNAIAESTSDNPMIKETGIQTEVSNLEEQKTMEAMEGDKKEIAKQKESEEKQVIEPKG
ncbi:hypothetical protein [Kaarinaea lacus]